MKSKVLSLSAISASLIAVSLILGAYIELVDLFTVILSSIFILMPIYLKSYTGSLLAYLAGGFIAFICSGFNYLSIVFPAYFAFVGVYPIVKCKMMDKCFNKYIGQILGLIWCVVVFYGVYFYYTIIMQGLFEGLPLWIYDYLIYIVGVVGILFFFIFDKFIIVMRLFLDRYLTKIIK